MAMAALTLWASARLGVELQRLCDGLSGLRHRLGSREYAEAGVQPDLTLGEGRISGSKGGSCAMASRKSAMARCIDRSVHLFRAYMPRKYASWAAAPACGWSRQPRRGHPRTLAKAGLSTVPLAEVEASPALPELVDDRRSDLILNREHVRSSRSNRFDQS